MENKFLTNMQQFKFFCVTNMQLFLMQSIINNFHSNEKELIAVWY